MTGIALPEILSSHGDHSSGSLSLASVGPAIFRLQPDVAPRGRIRCDSRFLRRARGQSKSVGFNH